jgi:GDP-L-fucose synthase
MKILVLGSFGFLGKHLLPLLSTSPDDILAPSRSELNLLDFRACLDFFVSHKPDTVVNLAAYSGGIGANQKYPADFYFQNTVLTANVFEAAAKCGSVTTIFYPIGGCSYPAKATSPINEQQLWMGFPQKESSAYSTSKMMGIVAGASYDVQFKIKTQIIIPGNMYGEHDNFNLESSHVIPALIRKFIDAKSNNKHNITLWGSGRPVRDFVYAGDVALILSEMIKSKTIFPIMNISSGMPTTIQKLAEMIQQITEFEGQIIWDMTKSDGQLEKVFCVKRMAEHGFACTTTLQSGLQRTIDWYNSSPSSIRL